MANCPSSWASEDGARKWIAKHLPRVSAKLTGYRDSETGVVLSWTDTAAAVAPEKTPRSISVFWKCQGRSGSVLAVLGVLFQAFWLARDRHASCRGRAPSATFSRGGVLMPLDLSTQYDKNLAWLFVRISVSSAEN